METPDAFYWQLDKRGESEEQLITISASDNKLSQSLELGL